LIVILLLLIGCNRAPEEIVSEQLTALPLQVVDETPTPSLTATNTPLSSPTTTSSPSPSPTPRPPTETPTTAPETATPTLTPSATPTVTPEPTTPASSQKHPAAQVYETTITLPTYPIWDYLIEQQDPLYNMPVLYLNRVAYDAAAPAVTSIDYKGIVIENAYVTLTFIPELGGRLYSAVVKSTGQEIFYQNPVVKPSRYGILQPVEANWWLAVGGMEWAYPTQEHGYRWGVPWDYELTETATHTTITLSDTAPGRVGVIVEVTLPHDSAAFTVAPTLTNAGAESVPIQFWLNSALALSPDTMSPNTQFIVPVDDIVIHSRGGSGWQLPDARETAPWPQVDSWNLGDYNQWADYLGFFVPNMAAPFMAAYNPDTDLGVARLVQPGAVVGNKLFAFGSAFYDRSYTDNDSQYFEIWGGVNTGFWPEDDVQLAPDQSLQWQEQWWPLAQLGGLTWANQQVAIDVTQHEDDTTTLSALFSQPTQGQLIISADDSPVLAESFNGRPDTPLRWDFSTKTIPLHIQIIDDTDGILLDYIFE
ncbi:MAG: DUF5107 domain-containing protein, partial [Chloroflexota bacterium]